MVGERLFRSDVCCWSGMVSDEVDREARPRSSRKIPTLKGLSVTKKAALLSRVGKWLYRVLRWSSPRCGSWCLLIRDSAVAKVDECD